MDGYEYVHSGRRDGRLVYAELHADERHHPVGILRREVPSIAHGPASSES